MTLIAPSTLIAIQSLTAPASSRQPKPQSAFQPIDTADPVSRRSDGVEIRLSRQARAHLGGDGGKGPSAAAPPAQQSPAAPAGSTLDITV